MNKEVREKPEDMVQGQEQIDLQVEQALQQAMNYLMVAQRLIKSRAGGNSQPAAGEVSSLALRPPPRTAVNQQAGPKLQETPRVFVRAFFLFFML
jgi:hypothetical protein